jgi:L-rhamnonate dehydratase
MNKEDMNEYWKINKIEWAVLPGNRARKAGSNARLGPHGDHVKLPLVRITIDGISGFGWSQIRRIDAEKLMNVPVIEMFNANKTIKTEYRSIEFALLDWFGRMANKPVYQLFTNKPVSDDFLLSVPCYDTSLYFNDLHLADDKDAVRIIQEEAVEGKERGHTNFKIKVGRGALHMPLIKGLNRDIAIIKGIREIAGADGKIMIDANNGYNVNLAKEVLLQTAEDRIYWIEEAFHEDPVLYHQLKQWMKDQKLDVLISDGEGVAAPPLLEWAKKGFVDVLQYDILDPGFSFWIGLGAELDSHGLKTSPHNYGSAYGNYATAHLASAIEGFQFVEWDQIEVSGLDCSGYTISQGNVQVSSISGFGLNLDDSWFSRMVIKNGWSLTSAI